MTGHVQTAESTPDRDQISRTVQSHLARAERRLRVLARERNDVLLAQALRSVRSAAALSAAPLAATEWARDV